MYFGYSRVGNPHKARIISHSAASDSHHCGKGFIGSSTNKPEHILKDDCRADCPGLSFSVTSPQPH